MSFPQIMANVPLFAGFEPRELDDFLGIFRRVSFAAGAVIVRQGQPADSAFVLESGTVEVITALPGGGQAVIAELGPGSVLGEMALLDSGARSATAIARAPTAAYVVEREDFRMLLAQRNPAVFKVQRRITLMLCRRLRELNARIIASGVPGNSALPVITPKQKPALRRTQCTFDYRAFLPILPPLRRFKPADIDGLLALATVFDMPRGATIFHERESASSCYLVVRGAIEIVAAENERLRRIGVLGPGRLCGILALIEGEPRSMTALLREDSTLLELSRDAFERIYDEHTHLAARFHDLVNWELLQALSRTNNHLTRLISQAQIRDRSARDAAKVDVEDLQRALGAQDCRAA